VKSEDERGSSGRTSSDGDDEDESAEAA
jgi:hypothetical protein